MIEIRITHNIKEMMRELTALEKRHAPFAHALTLTQLARKASVEIRDRMPRAFVNPTPYTLNSLRWKKATKENLTSYVWVKGKDDAGKGNVPESFIKPEVFGGPRSRKKFESKLHHAGYLPQGWFVVPGKAVKRDAYGNIPNSLIQKVLSALKASDYVAQTGSRRSGSKSDSTKESRLIKRLKKQGIAYRYIKPDHDSGLSPGIYEVTGRGTWRQHQMLFAFKQGAPNYRSRLNMRKIVDEVIARDLGYEFNKAMKRALNTSGFKGAWK